MQYKLIPKVDRLVVAREGACVRVTKLTARSTVGVSIAAVQVVSNFVIFQWIGCTLGVVAAGASVFSMVALWKKDEKFEQEVAAPVRAYLKKLVQTLYSVGIVVNLKIHAEK